MQPEFVIAVHGGAGTIRRDRLGTALEDDFHHGLSAALLAGQAVLSAGGDALEAVTRAVVVLEDEPLFNAGRGAVYTAAGRQEMDAAVMDGATRSAGAVAGISGLRNPVRAARAVMDHAEAVLLAGEGAVAFCRERGLEFEPDAYFHTPARWDALQRELDRRRRGGEDDREDSDRHGTVGAVAMDAAGNLAAATSTGGMTAKAPGRIGDTPLLGAGTWAENGICAVSATGTGELFIRHCAAHNVAARLRWAGQSLADAGRSVMAEIAADGGDGGLVALDHRGRVAFPLSALGMYRGVAIGSETPMTAIYADEDVVAR